jgi:hypothetical protein
MKSILTGFSLILLLTVSSCTKTDNISTTNHDSTTVVVRDTLYQTLKNPIVGLWVGSWKATTDLSDSSYYSFDIAGNGRMTTTSIGWAGNSDAATGPWQLSGTAFTATVTQLDGNTTLYVQAITAVYDSVAGTLAGTSTFTQGPGSDQTFLLLRVPN